jgi:hypothetical protein
MARARQRGAILVPTRAWPGSDLTLEVADRRWYGVGHGRGRLLRQEVTLSAVGRGRVERPCRATTALPLPSVSERVEPLPGQTLDLPAKYLLDPDRGVVGHPRTRDRCGSPSPSRMTPGAPSRRRVSTEPR